MLKCFNNKCKNQLIEDKFNDIYVCPVCGLIYKCNGESIDKADGTFKQKVELTIPYGLIKIGDDAFSNCDAITSVTIPDSVTTICRQAFENCSALTTVIMGKNVSSIGYKAFSGCVSLKNFTIPGNVNCIENSAFENCVILES